MHPRKNTFALCVPAALLRGHSRKFLAQKQLCLRAAALSSILGSDTGLVTLDIVPPSPPPPLGP